MNEIPEAEKSSVTKATVVAGLGYPNGREESSPEPTGEAGARGIYDSTGWLKLVRSTDSDLGDVSRETKIS
jgi:hypothetical protein